MEHIENKMLIDAYFNEYKDKEEDDDIPDYFDNPDELEEYNGN